MSKLYPSSVIRDPNNLLQRVKAKRRGNAIYFIYYIYASLNIFRACTCTYTTFRSTPPSARMSTKSFFDFNEIWYAGKGRSVTHDGMQYGPIQSQG